MDITLRNGSIRFDTNEVGFTRANVEALCSICHSSKPRPGRASKQTGEKGIGFKSAFNVADVVWIKSGPYSFRFDADKPLGKVTPIWAEFPQETLPGHTSIVLQLRSSSGASKLAQELSDLDARLLLFLRRIEQIRISVCDTQRRFFTVLRRRQLPMMAAGLLRVALEPGCLSGYVVSHHQVSQLPHDAKRDGSAGSEILIAFPAVASSQPSRIETQNVYAFFPIRDYGFKFIVQADFILTASREEIDHSSEWNIALRDQIPRALLKAISRLNELDESFSWLPYVVFDRQQRGFFQNLGQAALQLLAREPILKSIHGLWEPPRALTRIPTKLADEHGNSMIPPRFSSCVLVSQEYSAQDADALAGLGVGTLSDDEFLEDMSEFVSQYSSVFQAQTPAWHSRLAQILLPLVQTHRAQILTLPIIHLRDGRWVTPDTGQLLLPLRSSLQTVPRGIPAFEVHPSLARDDHWLQLLRGFGVKESGPRIVCDIITEMHTGLIAPPRDISSTDLIAHAVFLCRAQWKPASEEYRIWLVAEDGSRRPSDQIYVDTDLRYSASEVFRHHRRRFHFLHKKYEDALVDQNRWKEWMDEVLGVARLPRLSSPLQGGESSYALAEDFRFLMRHCSSKTILEILRNHWSYYYPSVEEVPSNAARVGAKKADEDAGPEDPTKQLRAALRSMDVLCHGGYSMPLSSTYLPRKNVLLGLGLPLPAANDRASIHTLEHTAESANVHHFLDVENPEDDSWNFLQHFGVIVLLEPAQFIDRLQQLQGTNISKDLASALYEQIMACKNEGDLGFIRRAFTEIRLIFIPPIMPVSNNHAAQWRRADECIWKGHRSLQKIPHLEKHYPSHREFFKSLLGIPDGSLKTLIAEVQKMASTDSFIYIRQLLETTSHYVHLASFSDLQDHDTFKNLRECRIWPVLLGDSNQEFDKLMDSQQVWYIPDYEHLRHSFEGKLPFLAFNSKTLVLLRPLFQLLGVERRNISAAAKPKPTIEGNPRWMLDYTNALMEKLIPITNPAREANLGHLHDIRVYQPQKIYNRWTVVTQSGEIVDGRAEPGRVCLAPRLRGLDIYLCYEDANAQSPPLELTEELASFCGIKDTEHIQLLTHILVQQDVQRIARDLDRRGVPKDDDAGLDDEGSLHAEDHEHDHTCAADVTNCDTLSIGNPSRPSTTENCGHEVRNTDLEPPQAIGRELQVLAAGTGRAAPETMSQPKNRVSDDFRPDGVDGLEVAPRSRSSTVMSAHLDDVFIDARSTPWKRPAAPPTYSSKSKVWDKVQNRYRLVTVGPMTRSVEYGVMASSIPRSFFLGAHNESEDNFIGQLYVSEFLAGVLEDDYHPGTHWTSPLRSRASHSPFQDDDPDVSTFTVQDKNGRLKEFLVKHGHREAGFSTEPMTFHIETVVSEQSPSSGFRLRSSQKKKAQILSFTSSSDCPRTEAFILAFVSKLHDDPGIALFPDPWRLYQSKLLSLEAYSGYWACFNEKAQAIHIPRGEDAARLPTNAIATYEYRDLRPGEIRLLKLSQGKYDMPLEGTIYHVSVDSAGPYRALSYVWGTVNSDLAPFYLGTPEGQIKITPSLDSGLRAIRSENDAAVLWIDAICIDQKNTVEKPIQIRLLSSIFRTASQVTAWLGAESDSSSLVISKLNSIAQDSKSTYWPKILGGSSGTSFQDFTDDLWAGIDAFLDRPWFKRAWIVQELVVSTKVSLVCGRSRIDWDDFFNALKLCERGLNSRGRQRTDDVRILPHAGSAYALGMTRDSFINQSLKFHLLQLMEIFAHCQATQTIDKIYALLGIACDSAEEEFDPDYDSPESTVIQRYAACFVQRGQVMDLLCRAGTLKSYSFCSWIPDWTRESFPESISTWETSKGRFYAGERNHPVAEAQRLDDSGPCVLRIRGCSVDTVVSTVQIRIDPSDEAEPSRASAHYRTLIDFVQDYPSGEDKQEILLRLPIGDAKRPHLESAMDRLRAYREFAKEQNDDWPSDLKELVWGKKRRGPRGEKVAREYWQTSRAFMNRISGAVFCTTSKGYVGLAPGSTEKGDEICIFRGGKTPFVLRKHDELKSVLGGECYIHGIMYGEAALAPGIKEVTFSIV
ncbi:hypothetical protein ACJ41O_006831 [Fusarium nematophilum]